MHKTVKGNIALHPNHITIPGAQGKNVTIWAQSLDVYTQFLSKWEVGATQAVGSPGSSFSHLWVKDNVFRESMQECLALVGLPEPGNLKPIQLEELLLFSTLEDDPDPTDNRGLIFRLHHDIPKIPALSPQDPQMSAIQSPSGTSAPSFWEKLVWGKP